MTKKTSSPKKTTKKASPKKPEFKFDSIADAVEEIANGRMVIVVDDEDRENEGDLVLAAHYATPETVNFMIRHGRGLVCVPVTDETLDRLQLKDMVETNRDKLKTAFTLSIDAAPKFGGDDWNICQGQGQNDPGIYRSKMLQKRHRVPRTRVPIESQKDGGP